MRILLLMQWFDPEPTFKGLVFAKKLSEYGHEVEVLTGYPNYPGGKIYPGYSIKPMQVEVMDGIRVTRIPLYPSHDSSAIRRIATYVSFGMSSCLAGLLAVRKPDVIYANGPPPTVGIAAAVVARLRKAPFVFDIQDLWPDSLSATGMMDDPRALRAVGWVCDAMYRSAARIVVPAPGIRDRLIARGVAASKISVIYNWCAESSIAPAGERDAESMPEVATKKHSGTFDVLFAGTMGKAQALDALLDAGEILKCENPAVRLLLMGGGIEVERLKRAVAERALTNVQLLPRVPMSEVGEVLSRADALIVHLKDDPLFRMAIPSKTQAYMAAGKPVIMAVAGDAARMIRESEAGVCAQPEHARSIADAIQQLATMGSDRLLKMGQSGRRYYRENLSLDVGARRFIETFESMLRVRSANS